jgi:hypothetical protein
MVYGIMQPFFDETQNTVRLQKTKELKQVIDYVVSGTLHAGVAQLVERYLAKV